MSFSGKSVKSKRILYSRITLLILVFFAFVFIYGLFDIVPKSREARKNKALAEKEYKALEGQKGELFGQLERIKTPEGIEENIRDKFQGAKEGEGLIVVINEETQNKSAENPPTRSFLNFLRKIFNN
jgi:cell division protein FtsB